MNYAQRLRQAAAETGTRYSNLTGEPAVAATQNLSQINRTYRVTVVNASNADLTYMIGGFNRYGDGNSAGSDTGVTVTTNMPGGTHGEMKREMQNSATTLAACRMRVTDAGQFVNSITYTVIVGSTTVTNNVEPLNAQSPTYNQSLIIDLNDFAGMEWNGSTQISGTIEGGVTINYVFNIGTRIDMGNAAFGQNVVKSTALPPPINTNLVPTMVTAMPAGVAGLKGGAVQ